MRMRRLATRPFQMKASLATMAESICIALLSTWHNSIHVLARNWRIEEIVQLGLVCQHIERDAARARMGLYLQLV